MFVLLGEKVHRECVYLVKAVVVPHSRQHSRLQKGPHERAGLLSPDVVPKPRTESWKPQAVAPWPICFSWLGAASRYRGGQGSRGERVDCESAMRVESRALTPSDWSLMR